MPNGKEICFAGGEFDTVNLQDQSARKDVETELNKIANVPSSMIYTKDMMLDSGEIAVHAEIHSSAERDFDIVNKVAPGTQTQALPQIQQDKPALNSAAAKASAQTATGESMAEKLAAARKLVQEAGNQKGPANPASPTATGAAAGAGSEAVGKKA